MGIRHLIVCDDKNRPRGIITRKELRLEFKQVTFKEKKNIKTQMKEIIQTERNININEEPDENQDWDKDILEKEEKNLYKNI